MIVEIHGPADPLFLPRVFQFPRAESFQAAGVGEIRVNKGCSHKGSCRLSVNSE